MKVVTVPFGPLSSNMYIIADGDDIFIVDPSVAYEVAASYFRFDLSCLRAIVITHGHFDHIMCISQYLASAHDVAVYMSPEDRPLLSSSTSNCSVLNGLDLSFGFEFTDIRTLTGLGRLGAKVYETPGHTKGSCSILLSGDSSGEKALFTGDTVFKGSIGRTDMTGGSWKDMKSSIELIKGFDKSLKLYPGHGPESTIESELENNPYFN